MGKRPRTSRKFPLLNERTFAYLAICIVIAKTTSWYLRSAGNGVSRSERYEPGSTSARAFGGASPSAYEQYVKTQASKLDSPEHHDNIVRDDKNKIEPEIYERFVRYQKEGVVDFLGKNAICVGARLGAEVRAMRRVGALAIGVDLNPGAENPHVLLGDAHSTAFASGSADLVYSNVLDHILEVDRFIDKVADQLAEGGQFLLDLSKKAPDEYATNDFRQTKGDVVSYLQRDFEVLHELDELKPESVWFIIARRKNRKDGKMSGSVPATVVIGEPIDAVRSRALMLVMEGHFVVAMSPGASKDKVVLPCSEDLKVGNLTRVEQIGRGAPVCSSKVSVNDQDDEPGSTSARAFGGASPSAYEQYVKTQASKLDSPEHHEARILASE